MPRLPAAVTAAALALAACTPKLSSPPPAGRHDPVDLIPAEEDWTDYGTVLRAGAEGEWDRLLYGGFAAAALKQDGAVLLYYQGACCLPEGSDTVTHRAIGLATSRDGVTFEKHADNPVLTWSPHGHGEEGAVSTGAVMGPEGVVHLYYGANTEEGPSTVNADARLATSEDGVAMTDHGVVLDHRDGRIWGAGDELFPIASIQHAGRWYVYYLPNGTREARRLGVAWGPRRDLLNRSAPARSRGEPVSAWGAGSTARIGRDTWALLLADIRVPHIEVRTLSLANPDRVSEPVRTYRFPGVGNAAALYDSARNTWFLYYRTADSKGYGLRLAPAGPRDLTPPSAPGGLVAARAGGGSVALTWSPSSDAETGVVRYNVYRDGGLAGTSLVPEYLVEAAAAGSPHAYSVSAVNLHGTEGPRSPAVSVPRS